MHNVDYFANSLRNKATLSMNIAGNRRAILPLKHAISVTAYVNI